ncbi:hypothetical protein LR48_Vigan05g010800 [Vigna angularis]|uniref:F-box domain-containing protein n=1 Tax=Phaseolus angularis TaxID=3914 RepID=A0A0L9UIX8_PHAAN|nr:hypothetical protein LR48_Vigan05g010800 [Vigna angularis]
MNKHQQSFTAAKNGPSPATADQIYERRKTPTNILSLDPDIVCTIFAFLDMFDLVRCSLVCKLWNAIVESRSLREFCERNIKNSSSEFTEKPLRVILGEMVMEQHRLALLDGGFYVDHYVDPEAVVGCDDGAVRVFDMYSRRCSQILRMHPVPITCLCLNEDRLIVSGSTSGDIRISDPSSVQQVATLRSSDVRGIRTMCFNPSSQLLFAGSAVGCAYCWDLRTRKLLWSSRVCPNVIYSLQHMQNDTSTLVVGGIDGILRLLNQNDGKTVACFSMDDKLLSTFQSPSGSVQRIKGQRLPEDDLINIEHLVCITDRPSITCLAVGMKKIVTTHNTSDIRLWKFRS